MASIRSLLCPRRLQWILGACAPLVTFIAVRPLLAADISGTWDLSCRIGPEQQTITLELVQDGSQVSGFGILRTDDMGSPVRVAVRSGTAQAGDFLLFLVEAGRSGGHPQEVRGRWYRDEMDGQTNGAFGARMFIGVRRSPDN